MLLVYEASYLFGTLSQRLHVINESRRSSVETLGEVVESHERGPDLTELVASPLRGFTGRL